MCVAALLALAAAAACQRNETPESTQLPVPALEHAAADVVSVGVSGPPGAYRFEVGVRSPDLGCRQYADWWEIVDESGRLLYRRVLSHSHVDEQPFVRGGEPVPIASDTTVWVRAHMTPGGYGGKAFNGSVDAGFIAADPPAGFAANLGDEPPSPPPCRW